MPYGLLISLRSHCGNVDDGGGNCSCGARVARALESALEALKRGKVGRVARSHWVVTARPPKGRDGKLWQLRYRPPADHGPHDGRKGKPGRDYCRSAKTSDPEAARAFAAAEQDRLNSQEPPVRRAVLLYLEWLDTQPVTDLTRVRYRIGGLAVADALGDQHPTRKAVLEARDKMAATLAPKTISIYLATARRAWRWALEREHVNGEWPEVAPLRQPRTHLRPPSPEEAAQIMGAAMTYQGGIHYPWIALCAETGSRITETLSLRGRDVDRERRTVSFVRRYKTASSRRAVPVSPEILDILPDRGPDELLFLGVRSRRQIERGTAYSIWRGVIAQAGLTGEPLGGPHALRRCWVGASQAAGVHEDHAMRLVGHSDVKTHRAYAQNSVSADLQGAAEAVRAQLALPHLTTPPTPPTPPESTVGGAGDGRSSVLQVQPDKTPGGDTEKLAANSQISGMKALRPQGLRWQGVVSSAPHLSHLVGWLACSPGHADLLRRLLAP